MKERGEDKLQFSFEEIKELSAYKSDGSLDRFISDLRRMNRKLAEVTCEIETEEEVLQFVLFPTFRISKVNRTLTVSVNHEFNFILNELTKNFTRFELAEFVRLESKYSKCLFRQMKQFKETGLFRISVEELRERMDAPEAYSNKYLMDKIIKPSIEELKPHFDGLECEPIYSSRRGRPIEGYEFKWKPEKREKKPTKTAKPEKSQKPKTNRFNNFHQRNYTKEQLDRMFQ